MSVMGPWAWQMVLFENAHFDGTMLDDYVGCKEPNLVLYFRNSQLGYVSWAWWSLNCLGIVQESVSSRMLINHSPEPEPMP